MNKHGNLLLQLNNINQNEDFTLMNAEFAILDFNESWNGQIVDKELAVESAPTLKNKPIVAKYYKKSNVNENDDHLGDHEEFIDVDRNGEAFINMDTLAIGTFIDEGYVKEVDGKEVLVCNAVLWKDKYPDIIGLLQEWYDNGIKIITSCEYVYKNYEVVDGVEYIKSPLIFTGHAILNSEPRGDSEVVLGAYDSSQLMSLNHKRVWNKTVAQAIEKERKGEGMEFYKKVCELSHGTTHSKIYEAMSKNVSADEFNKMWLSDYNIYDDYFIYETYEADNYLYYKVNYSKEEDEVSVDMSSKVQVEIKRDWQEVSNQLDVANEKIEELNKSLNEKDESIKELNSKTENLNEEKQSLNTKLSDATDKLTSLNERIEKLSEVEEKYNKEKFEQALNEKKDFYEKKFKAVNAIDKFKSEEVQDMIEKSINDDSFATQLNSVLVDCVELKEEDPKEKQIKEFNSKKLEDLVPEDSSFESRYMEQ